MFNRLYRYGKAVNSHDLLKVIATVLMIIDHVGYYLLHDAAIFRIPGRGAAPIFFFLVGTAPKQRFYWRLFLYGCLLTAVNIFFFNHIYINILLNFVMIKAVLASFEPETMDNFDLFVLACLLLFAHPYLTPYLEYGTCGLLLAISARLIAASDRRGHLLLIIASASYFLFQAIYFNFIENIIKLTACLSIGIVITLLLYNYRFRTWSVPAKLPILFISRYSLGIYFWHLLFLKFYLLYQIFKLAKLID